MNIVFGNQKGGVGKSTLCVMLANYLTLVKQKETVVLDMDFQKSIDEMRKADTTDNKGDMPYKVYPVETAEYPKYAALLKSVDGIVLIDLPGRLDDKTLFQILAEADYIICPFDYERQCFASTMTFAKFVKYIDKDKKIFFVPNRIKLNVNYQIKENVDKELSDLGTITKPITDRITFKRMKTYDITEEQKRVVEEVFDFIYKKMV
jgi:chromosome partitioning protein